MLLVDAADKEGIEDIVSLVLGWEWFKATYEYWLLIVATPLYTGRYIRS